MAGRRQRARAAKAKRINLEAFEQQELERKAQIAAIKGSDRYDRGFKSSVVSVMDGLTGPSRGKAFAKSLRLGEVDAKHARYVAKTVINTGIATKIATTPLTQVREEDATLPDYKRRPIETRDNVKHRQTASGPLTNRETGFMAHIMADIKSSR